jgi:hypothetical protein
MEVKKMSEEFLPIVILASDRTDIQDFDSRIEQTQYWVEANNDVYHHLWERFAWISDDEKVCTKVYDWKCDNTTIYMSIGSWFFINYPEQKYSITIDIRWATINNIRVGFYTSYSGISSSRMMKHFLKLHSSSYRSGLFENATNFNPSRMVHEIESRKISEGDSWIF